jgi:ectoine hydroxylase-related dioxygenase (phytanoyl-CoA dioxygenase family)
MTALTPEQLRRFDEDGYVIVDRLLTADQVERARAAMVRIFRGEYRGDRRPHDYRKPLPTFPDDSAAPKHLVNGRLLDDDLWEISRDGRLAEMAATLLRTPRLSLLEDQLIGKAPRSGPIAFHQDAPYLTFLRSWDMINCWIALTDTTPATSPLLCIRGSHRWPLSPKPSRFADGAESDMAEAVEAVRPPDQPLEVVPVVVPASGGVFFAAMTMHGSGPNTSDRHRYAYSLHYAGAGARADTSRWSKSYHPFIVEGVEDGGPIVSRYLPLVYGGTS